jgi:uncharacterized protein YndB with AHSA1/START domain
MKHDLGEQPSSSEDSVAVEIHIAAPPDRVFEALIDEGQLMRWFTGPSHPAELWKVDAQIGGLWRFVSKEGKPGVNGKTCFKVHGEILQLDRPHLLEYSWIADWHEHPERPTIVRWELAATSDGTRVRVIHSGLAEEPVVRKDYGNGWVGVLANLKKFTEQERIET